MSELILTEQATGETPSAGKRTVYLKTDGKLYLKESGGTEAAIGTGGGSITVSVVSTTSETAVASNHYVLTNVAATTVTLPASPASGDTVWVTVANSLTTNVIARNGETIMGVAEDMTIDNQNATVELRFVNSSWRLV
jgi:hypothetical protein